MRKPITLGLIAGALALTTAAFAPTEAQANNNQKALNQLAMQMYMNNMAAQQQQQFYNYNNPYYGNPYNNGYYGNQFVNGNGCYNGSRWNNSWNNGYNWRGSTVGRILNRIF
ncbi:MAG: hypothetical protein C0507_08905 [Cyanobacteria bacterium PR.3.49]|jgi:hypothetical protein|nr:hypothetical protein [Cyanobacteria bacterium PR.3.49]